MISKYFGVQDYQNLSNFLFWEIHLPEIIFDLSNLWGPHIYTKSKQFTENFLMLVENCKCFLERSQFSRWPKRYNFLLKICNWINFSHMISHKVGFTELILFFRNWWGKLLMRKRDLMVSLLILNFLVKLKKSKLIFYLCEFCNKLSRFLSKVW